MGDAEERAADLRRLAVELVADGQLTQAKKAADLAEAIAQDTLDEPT